MAGIGWDYMQTLGQYGQPDPARAIQQIAALMGQARQPEPQTPAQFVDENTRVAQQDSNMQYAYQKGAQEGAMRGAQQGFQRGVQQGQQDIIGRIVQQGMQQRTMNPAEYQLANLLTQDKINYQNAQQAGDQAGMDAAARSAAFHRQRGAEQGIQISDFGADKSLADAQAALAYNQAMERANIESMPNEAELYAQNRDAALNRGIKDLDTVERIAQQMTAAQMGRLGQAATNTLYRQGITDNAVNDWGMRIATELMKSDPQAAQMALGGYAHPVDNYNLNAKVAMANLMNALGQSNMALQQQYRQSNAAQAQQYQQSNMRLNADLQQEMMALQGQQKMGYLNEQGRQRLAELQWMYDHGMSAGGNAGNGGHLKDDAGRQLTSSEVDAATALSLLRTKMFKSLDSNDLDAFNAKVEELAKKGKIDPAFMKRIERDRYVFNVLREATAWLDSKKSGGNPSNENARAYAQAISYEDIPDDYEYKRDKDFMKLFE